MEESRPNIGVLLPTREAVISGRSDPSVLFQLAQRAEVLGFDSVWVGDSLTARPRIDALTTLAAVGARTKRVRLGTAIFLAALRHPILLAYQLGSLDWMTGGRIRSEERRVGKEWRERWAADAVKEKEAGDRRRR